MACHAGAAAGTASSQPADQGPKAAVLALTRHTAGTEARAALATATADPDADVRAYAARAR
ncbi:hypothetical protein SFUMM280S_05477 [Streptomyces fumanus]